MPICGLDIYVYLDLPTTINNMYLKKGGVHQRGMDVK